MVFRASCSPFSMPTVTSNPPEYWYTSAALCKCCCIIFLGTGLMAGSPMPNTKPLFVTVPTPGPALNTTPGCLINANSTNTQAPWVTSGSSPASLIVEVFTRSGPTAWYASSVKLTCLPRGKVTSTCLGCLPASRLCEAATQQAVAQVPVVNPLRSACLVSLLSGHIGNHLRAAASPLQCLHKPNSTKHDGGRGNKVALHLEYSFRAAL